MLKVAKNYQLPPYQFLSASYPLLRQLIHVFVVHQQPSCPLPASLTVFPVAFFLLPLFLLSLLPLFLVRLFHTDEIFQAAAENTIEWQQFTQKHVDLTKNACVYLPR